MFLDNDISPTNDVYYLGSRVIEVLAVEKTDMIDFFDVYQKLNNLQNISMTLFVFTVDWLFLLGLVKKGNDGYIKKCF